MDARLADRLGQLIPLDTLTPQQRVELADNGERVRLASGEILFRRGDRDEDAVYLLSGAVDLDDGSGETRQLRAGEGAGNYALGNLQPRPATVTVSSEAAEFLRVPRVRVEKMVARTQVVTGEMPAVRVTDLGGEGDVEAGWLLKVLQSALFRDLPNENIERFLAAVRRQAVDPGKAIVEQGEAGDDFYMIAHGECEVMRNARGVEFPIARLGPGDSFGEESLISGMPRNATVRAKTPVVLMRLASADFNELLRKPTIRSVAPKEAARRLRAGECTLLDVRLPGEHARRSIRGSTSLPLYQLRDGAGTLDRDRPVITYCDTGERSRVAAFLLCQRGFDASYLEGGLSALAGD